MTLFTLGGLSVGAARGLPTKKRKRKFCVRYFIHSVVFIQPEEIKNSVIFTIAKS